MWVVSVGVAVAVAASVAASGEHWTGERVEDHHWRGVRVERVEPQLPACVEEDGSGGPLPCVWDPAVRGNGSGGPVIVFVPPTVEA